MLRGMASAAPLASETAALERSDQSPGLGGLTWGSELLLLWENLPSLGPPWGRGMGFDCTESPSFLPLLSWFLLHVVNCTGSLQSFFIDGCSADSCDFGVPVRAGALWVSLLLAALPSAEPEIPCGFCSPTYRRGNLDVKLLSLGRSASRWQSWASNLSLTPSGSLFAKTGVVAALFEPGVTGFLTHVYMWVAGQSEGTQERQRGRQLERIL